jgi:ABC-2 type transport system permease protein
MNIKRISALVIRHLYLYKRSWHRLADVFFWPIIDLVIWGFLSVYLKTFNISGINVVTVLLGAVIFWSIFAQAKQIVTISFLNDVWERNLLNVFISPISIWEFILSRVVLGFLQILIILVVSSVVAFFLYHFNIFTFGLAIIPFVVDLAIFGWSLGLFAIAIILRLGSSAEFLAFGLSFLFQPFCAVFYPVSALPQSVQWISWLLPPTYIFEGMRTVAAGGVFPMRDFLISLGLNLVYLVLIVIFFTLMFKKVKKMGRLLKLD